MPLPFFPARSDNGYGQIYDYQICTLKQSDRVASGQDPNFYFKAPSVPWTSGWLPPPGAAGRRRLRFAN